MNYRKIILISTSALVLLIAIAAYRSTAFHVVSTNPPLSKFPDAMPYVDINFSKKISSKPSVSLSPDVLKSTEISDKSMRIRLKAITAGKVYSITLKNVRSADNKTLNKTLKFRPQKLLFEHLPKDQQQAIVNSQDPNDPSLLTNDPLVAHLPYGDIGYNISYVITTSNNKPALIIYVGVILAGADYRQSPPDLQNTINQREQEALAYIRSLGLDSNKYNIQYVIPLH